MPLSDVAKQDFTTLIIDTKARGSAKSNTAASPSPKRRGSAGRRAAFPRGASWPRDQPRSTAGRPADPRRPSAAAAVRARRRKAGLEGKAVRRKLAEIPALVLPAVLSMRDGSTRILLAIDLDTKTASVVDPSSSTRRNRARCANSTPNILVSHSWFARQPAPMRALSPPAICPRALVLVGRPTLLVELQPRCDRRTDCERAGARKPPLHHERL